MATKKNSRKPTKVDGPMRDPVKKLTRAEYEKMKKAPKKGK